MPRTLLLALLLFGICACDVNKPDDTGAVASDLDGDGFPAGEDCDDTQAAIHPGAEERCDGVDNDCDGEVDEADASDATTWYTDADGDGYGSDDATSVACEAPSGTVEEGGDCDDGDAAVNPQAAETCNDIDDDCDGTADDGLDFTSWYRDADEDGYGDGGNALSACSQPSGFVGDDSDCDDAVAAINPGATEICNGVDDDCDGAVDDDDSDLPADAGTWYLDADSDGYGLDADAVQACQQPTGRVDQPGDCDDADPDSNPGASEVCDGRDNDCNDDVDDGLLFSDWYADADGDSYGDAASALYACSQPTGYLADDTDCDDSAAEVNPGAAEVCNGVDDDCDGDVDDGLLFSDWYADGDGDGYGDAGSTINTCSQPTGYLADNTDCDDSAAAINPAAAEACDNGVDDDCDGDIDEGCVTIVEHCGTISTSETWSASDLHLVTCSVYVQGNTAPVLTIEDGATVMFESGLSLYVGTGNYGELVVDGGSAGVLFTSAQSSPAAGDWDCIQFGSYNMGSQIVGATVEYGGSGSDGNIYIYTTSPTIRDSIIQYGASHGIYAYGSGAQPSISGTWIGDNAGNGFAGSTAGLDLSSGPSFIDNVITGNSDAAVSLLASYAAALDASSSFTGNGQDRVKLYASTLATDATWQALDAPYRLTGSVYVQGSAAPVLTIEDGAEVQLDSGVNFYVGTGNYGALMVEGTSAGVTFTSSQSSPAAGDWDYLQLGSYDMGSVLTGLNVEYGGSSGYGSLYFYFASPTLSGCSVSDSASEGIYGYGAFPGIRDSLFFDNVDDGIYLNSSSGLSRTDSPSFEGNVLTGNGDYPLSVPANYAGEISASNTFSGNGDDYVRLLDDTVDTDATWRPQDVPYAVSGSIYVQGSAAPVVTVEDGVDIAFKAGAALYVGTGNYGGLDVQGSTTGVRMTSAESSPQAGDWDIFQYGSYTVASTLEGLTLEYGGGYGYGAIYLYYAPLTLTGCILQYNETSGLYVYGGTVAVSDSLIYANEGPGIKISSTGALATGTPSFTGNILTGNGTYAIQIPANSVGELDSSSSFSGNGEDTIRVTTDTVDTSATWQAHDVDYRFTESVFIQGSTSPLVDIEAGAVLRFDDGVQLYVGTGNYGALSASGTATDPVLFGSSDTSAPAAGDWEGIQFGSYCVEPSVNLQYITVEYGGGYGFGNLYFYHCDATVAHATIQYSSSYGIWRTGCTPTLTDIVYAGNVSGDLH